MIHLKQGDNCKYVLKHSGLFNDKIAEFKTEQELDVYIESLLNSDIEINGETGIFSVDHLSKTREKLNEIKLDVESVSEEYIRYSDDPEETETYKRIPNSIGSTRFLGEAGNRGDMSIGIIPPFVKSNWEEHFRDTRGRSVETEEMIRQQEEELWPTLTQYGTDVHEVIDATFKGEGYERTTKTKISDEQIRQVKQYAEKLMSDLKERHGATAEFYTEFAFKSKELDARIKPILEARGYDSINGKADLLVVDEWGNIHIYDFKVSRKHVDQSVWEQTDNELIPNRDYEKGIEGDWKSSKKYSATNQLALYKAILAQHGLNVVSGNIVPVELKFDYESEFEIKGLRDIKFNKFEDNILNVPGATAGKEYNHIIGSIIPQPGSITGEEAERILNIYQNFIPTTSELFVKRRETTIESLKRNKKIRTLPPTHPKVKEGKKYSFVWTGVDGHIDYASEEELDSKLLAYVTKLNSIKANECVDLANLISSELSGERDYTKIVGNVSTEHQARVQEEFKKYFKQGGWTFNNDATLTSLGIFMFTRGDDVEIITITNDRLFDVVNLGVGTTLLGKNTKNKYVGSRNILPSTNANINLMKTLIYISENQNRFEGKRIVNIKAFNPWFGQVSEFANNEQLIENYEALRLRNPDAGARQIKPSIFYTNVESIIKQVESKSEMLDKKVLAFDEEKYDASQVESLTKYVTNALSQLKFDYRELYDKDKQKSSVAWDAYVKLNQLLMEINRINPINELDVDKAISSNFKLGTYVTSAQFSASKNIQEFARLHDRYVAEVRMAVQKNGFKMQKMFKKLYDTTGITGAKAFDSWFRRDPDGKISKEFMLIDPESGEFDGTPVVKETLQMFLETMYKIRFPNATESDIENAKTTGDYFKVPLTEAVFSRQAKNLGFFKAIKNKVNEFKELTEGVFAGEADLKEEWESSHDSLYNKFLLTEEARNSKLERHGVGFFETNLEIVFNQALVAYTKQDISETYVPLFKALQVSLMKMENDKNKLKDVNETIDLLIQNRFYGKNIMKGETVKKLYSWLSVISRAFSTMKLGLNVRTFLRETLTGMYIGASRVMVKQHGNVSLENYNKAVSYVIQDLPNNPSGVSMLQQMNAIYGMANYSLTNVANQRKVNWLNINNWGKDTLFIGCSAPDYQHRMAILIAKMMDDGCWDAFSLDENEELQYDFKKDKRFEVYLSGDTSNPKYLEQKTLYLKNIEEWNAQGYRKPDGSTLVEGDALPQPYTNREAQSVKNYADILYGHYDDESRSLLNDLFIGSFFMQFKTFVTAKLEQWTMNGGVYNVEYLKQQFDPITGEKLYEIIKYPNPDNTGMPYREIVKESNLGSLTEDEKSRVRPYIEWTGQPMEGMARGAINMIKAMFGWSEEDYKKIWNDPHERGLLLLGMSDMLLMGILAIVIKALYGAAVGSEEWQDINRDVRNSNYFTSLSYNVLRGIANDNNITSVISSMASDVNPPFLTNLKQFMNSCYSVVLGDQSLSYALTRNVGALSDLSGMVKQWEASQK